ncbi:MAG: LPS assembly protein LptD [Rhodovibrionaceae bacterium]
MPGGFTGKDLAGGAWLQAFRLLALRLVVALVLLGLPTQSLLAAGSLIAQDQLPDGEIPALISADSITYDQNLGVVTATGDVEVAQGDYTVLADTISYNMRSGLVSASGNVALVGPRGDVVFSNYLELKDNLREGFIRDIRVLLSDDSRIAAASGSRTGGTRTTFNKAVFSPCPLCPEDPMRAPLWQLKAERVVHDQDEETIAYHNAWMEIYGVPVLYTPYFEHPDPSVERKSGFLSPSFGISNRFGGSISTPYYWTLGPDEDFTFTPLITTKQNAQLAGEYRRLYENGFLELRASATVADREDEDDGDVDHDVFRGHIDAEGEFDLDDTWRAGFDVEAATDDTYLRAYDISNDSRLTSRAFLEGFRGRTYASVESFAFQTFRQGEENDELPIIAPIASYNFVGEPMDNGSKFNADASFMNLYRQDGRDVRRLSANVSWDLPYTTPGGHVFKVTAGLQGAAYWTYGVDPDTNDFDPPNPQGEDFAGRLFPYLAMQWRYPLISHHETFYQTIEPIAQIVVAPDGGNSGDIPNEDSLEFEFDDTNIFSINRFPGVDRVSPGQRFDYGVKWTYGGYDGGYAEVFLGQSFRLDEAEVFDNKSGVRDNVSDIVGRTVIRPIEDLDLSWRFRLDSDDFSLRRNELVLDTGPEALNMQLGYSFIDGGVQEDFPDDRHELIGRINSQFTEYWSGFVQHRHDLEKGRELSTSVGLTYENECCTVAAIYKRSNYDDREIDPDESIFFQVSFKHLGSFSN